MVKIHFYKKQNKIFFSGNPKFKKIVYRSLKFFNENCIYSTSFNEGKWDGYVRLYNKREDSFPIGLINRVLSNFSEEEIEFHDFNFTHSINVRKEQLNEYLNPHQKEAVIEFLECHYGIIQVPTRGRKTLIAGEIMAQAIQKIPNCKILFIVDSSDLFAQSQSDLKKYLNLKSNQLGKIKAEDLDLDKQVTFGMIQTLKAYFSPVSKKRTTDLEKYKLKKKERIRKRNLLIKFLQSIDLCIVDEVHEFGSSDCFEFLKRINNASFMLALSATPFKSNNGKFGNLNIESIFGQVIYKIPEKLLIKRNILAQNKTLLLFLNHELNKNIDIDVKNEIFLHNKFLYLQRKILTENDQRNNILIHTLEILRKMSLKVLVMFSLKQHGREISNITGDPFISGDNKVIERQSLSKQFLRGKGKILMASSIYKKGITLPQVEVLFNASGGLEDSLIIQKRGRVLGVTKDKNKALTIDFLDNYEFFSDHSLNRLKVYEKMNGKENVMLLDCGDPHFYNDFRDLVKQWFSI